MKRKDIFILIALLSGVICYYIYASSWLIGNNYYLYGISTIIFYLIALLLGEK